MKFEYLAGINDESSPRSAFGHCRNVTDTLHVEPWYEEAVSENRLCRDIDALWDIDAIYKGEDGKLYTAYQCWIDGHEGEFAMWAEIESDVEAL